MLSRRDFLRFAALTGASSAFPGCASPMGLEPAPGRRFPASALRSSRRELDVELEVVAGRLPADMEGFVFVVGAVPYGDGTPMFTGDAMVYRFSFAGRPSLRSRLLRTPDFLVDQAAAGTDHAFRNYGMARISNAFGGRNFANTGLVPCFDGRLLATYDAGRPVEIDPLTLDVVTPVGREDSWLPFLPPLNDGWRFFSLLRSTAHPAYDEEDGRLFAVNYASAIEGLDVAPFTRILAWDGRSEPVATTLVDEAGAPALLQQSCHQMQVTRDHVVLCDGAFHVEVQQLLGGDVVEPQRPETVLWIVPKASLAGGTATARRVVLPMEAAHFLVERDDGDGTLRVLLAHQNSADPSEWIRPDDVVHSTGATVSPDHVGMMVAPADQAPLGRYAIDLGTGGVTEQRTLYAEDVWATALWTQDDRHPGHLAHRFWSALGFAPELLPRRIVEAYRGHPYRHVPVQDLPDHAVPGSLFRVDHDGMTELDRYELPLGHLPMSPTFVPRRGSGPHDGYLVVLVVGDHGDEVWVLDAGDLSRGPLCRLRHRDLDLGFTLHTTWLGDVASPPAGYRVSARDDYADRLAFVPEDARALARGALGL